MVSDARHIVSVKKNGAKNNSEDDGSETALNMMIKFALLTATECTNIQYEYQEDMKHVKYRLMTLERCHCCDRTLRQMEKEILDIKNQLDGVRSNLNSLEEHCVSKESSKLLLSETS